MTVDEVRAILPALSRLNAWARVPYEQKLGMSDAAEAIYRYKLHVIRHAIASNMAKIRGVLVGMPCRTCRGSGIYSREDWSSGEMVDLGDCRRCGGTGRVVLRFVETTIEGVKWHTPYNTWPQGISSFVTERIFVSVDDEDWRPGVVGDAVLDRLDLIDLLNQVERIVCGDKLIRWGDFRRRNYHLHLGTIGHCVFCERTEEALTLRYRSSNGRLFPHPIYRPGIVWEQGECYGHHWKSFEPPWPLNMKRWIRDQRWQDYAPLPDLAFHPLVTEWLARRGIVIGGFVPGEAAWTADTSDMVTVIATTPQGIWGTPYIRNHGELPARLFDPKTLSARPRKLLTAA